MSSLDPFLAMVHGVQALRRRVERDRSAVLGALGVAAEALPHQLANVIRILEAHELRFLIADGVGLGKTVQTLMVLNVLRLRDPNHRTLLVVPDHLVEQWVEELATRGHLSADFASASLLSDEPHTEAPVQLVRPSDLLNSVDLLRAGPDRFDMLVLDEPQTFTVRQRDALARARPFAQFLALTATPEFHREDMRHWFMRMIEPLRVGVHDELGSDPLTKIRRDEAAARRQVENGAQTCRFAFERNALGRRICRWSREDWPDYMPKRDYSRSNVATFEREALLAAQARVLVNQHLEVGSDEEERSIDLIRRARALHRVGRSARDAIAALPAAHFTSTSVEADEPEVRGDSRFDALLSHLTQIWSREREARVLIVAGDNDTVERLNRLLPAFFADLATGKTLDVASLARGGESASSAETAIVQSHETLGTFISGDDKVLLIGDWVEAGLNLHYTCSEIIFYSCPWDVRSIDQLVGRLDRLRRKAGERAFVGKKQGRIGIHVVSWAGSPEARVIDGLERLGVFERPAPPSTDDTGRRIAEHLHALAAGRNVDSALATLEELGKEKTFEAALSQLVPFSPYSSQAAREAYVTRMATALVPGSLETETGAFGRRDEESALKAWLDALRVTHLLDVRYGLWDALGERFSSAWYAESGVRHSPETRSFVLDIFERRGEGDRRAIAATGMVGFNLYRHHLSDPPRRFVERKDGRLLALEFLDHGDTFHEQLCSVFVKSGDEIFGAGLRQSIVEYSVGHAALKDQRPMLITAALRAEQLPILPPDQLVKALNRADKRDRKALHRIFTAMAAADERWFLLNCPPRLHLDGAYVPSSGSVWEDALEVEVLARLDPRAKKGPGARHLNGRASRAVGAEAEAECRRSEIGDFPALGIRQETIGLRLELVQAEFDRLEADTLRLAQEERNRSSEDENQRRLTEGRAYRIERRLEAVRHFSTLRLARIEAAHFPEASSEERCWQIIVHPRERALL